MAENRTSVAHQATARKWRPDQFADVVGQEHVTRTLQNAIRTDRLHHAYLFCGPRGVGKTTTARLLAKALNCTNRGEDLEPCNECESCRAIAEGRSMDVVEIDGASNNSVDDVRGLRDSAKYPPVEGDYKLYIIDEVHMLSTSAFNALLKTLEEPPRHLIFVFATTEPHKVIPTILSRCQRFDFRRMQIDDIVARLQEIAGKEGINTDADALTVIARKADGSMRDAQSVFDQVRAFCGETFEYGDVNSALNLIDAEVFFRVTDMMASRTVADAFEIVRHISETGHDLAEFLIGIAEHIRNLLTIKVSGTDNLIEAVESYRDRYRKEAVEFEQADLVRGLHLVLAAQSSLKSAPQPRLRCELLLVQLATIDRAVEIATLLESLGESNTSSGGSNVPSPESAEAPASSSASAPPTSKSESAAARNSSEVNASPVPGRTGSPKPSANAGIVRETGAPVRSGSETSTATTRLDSDARTDSEEPRSGLRGRKGGIDRLASFPTEPRSKAAEQSDGKRVPNSATSAPTPPAVPDGSAPDHPFIRALEQELKAIRLQ